MELTPGAPPWSRRAVLAAATASAAGLSFRPGGAAAAPSGTARDAGHDDRWKRSLRELDAKVEAAMRADGIPGVAVGVLLGKRAYVRGFGLPTSITRTR